MQRSVAEAVKIETDDSDWPQYVIVNGRVVKGGRTFSNEDKAVLRHHLKLTQKQLAEYGLLRIGLGGR